MANSAPILKILLHLNTGRASLFEGSATSVTVGRDESCDVSVDARGVSRNHCELEFQDGQLFIRDLDSTNGTVLRRLDHEPLELKRKPEICDTGDRIEVGEALLEVKIVRRANSSSTEILEAERPEPGTELWPRKSHVARQAVKHESPMEAAGTLVHQSEKDNDSHSQPPTIDVVAESSSAIDQAAKRELPFKFRDYTVTKEIGQGGMGDVFLGQRSAPNADSPELLALKLLRRDEGGTRDQKRFLREMDIALNLRHSAIVSCLDCGQEQGELFIVMPYCPGGNLTELLKRSGSLKLRRAVRLMDRLLSGMEHAHKQGIVHRDLKPSNILLDRDSGSHKYQPKICDFGLAKSFLLAGDSGMTVDGTVGGSWPYMPKEQLLNFRFVTPQSDVWSLGAIMYEALTLQPPRVLSPDTDPIHAVLSGEIVHVNDLVPDIPKSIARFVMKALAIETSDRFLDATQMRKALHVAAGKAGMEI